MKVYTPKIVQEIEAFYGDLLSEFYNYPTLKDHLGTIAYQMLIGVQDKKEEIFAEINNYHPDHLGWSIVELSELSFDLDDCRHTIANEHGFQSWAQIGDTIVYDRNFEAAVNHLLSGNLSQLRALITKDPGLIKRTSSYGHKATLLHYAGSNGVEFWRQKVPCNLPEIVAYLLGQGADKEAKMKVYGGAFTTLQLMMTSAHPREAGLARTLETLLKG